MCHYCRICCVVNVDLSKLLHGFLKANICICQVVINISSDGGEEEVAFDWLFGCITIVNQTALSCPSQLSDGPAWSSRRLKPHSCSMIGRNCLGFVTDKPVNSARYSFTFLPSFPCANPEKLSWHLTTNIIREKYCQSALQREIGNDAFSENQREGKVDIAWCLVFVNWTI